MTRTAISLIVPSYRRGKKIGPTLDSILAQTLAPDEVLVVNDGGWSETSEFVRARFPTVRVLDIEHGGAAVARNRGALAASHPILMFLDDDDTLLPSAAEILLNTLTAFPTARAAHADSTYTNHITGKRYPNHHAVVPEFKRLRSVRPLDTKNDVRLYGRAMYYALLHGNLLQQPWMVYRDTFLAVGGFQSGLGSADDWDLYLRITRTAHIAQTDEVIANHFVEAGRPHLTLGANQVERQMEATRRQRALASAVDIRALMVLNRKIALYYKALGDEQRTASYWRAWHLYWRSALSWPFDAVVIARLVLWPLRAVEAMLKRRGPDAHVGHPS